MTDYMLFEADHAITLRWRTASRAAKVRRGKIQRISQSELVVRMPKLITAEDSLRAGDTIRAEAPGYGGANLTVFKGSVKSVEARLIRISIGGEIGVIQRRRFLRARVPYQFASATLFTNEMERRFVVQPVDLSRGGIRNRHRLRLSPGDMFRVTLRLDEHVTVTAVGQIVESWEAEQESTAKNPLPLFISRATFVDLPRTEQQQISRYVFRLLRTRG
jgi:c-di-GMP-binding flagellar brake protein YcgR